MDKTPFWSIWQWTGRQIWKPWSTIRATTRAAYSMCELQGENNHNQMTYTILTGGGFKWICPSLYCNIVHPNNVASTTTSVFIQMNWDFPWCDLFLKFRSDNIFVHFCNSPFYYMAHLDPVVSTPTVFIHLGTWYTSSVSSNQAQFVRIFKSDSNFSHIWYLDTSLYCNYCLS